MFWSNLRKNVEFSKYGTYLSEIFQSTGLFQDIENFVHECFWRLRVIHQAGQPELI
jgi:hypothetical protein